LRSGVALVAGMIVLLLWGRSSHAETAANIQGGYTTKPLEQAVFDPARVAVEATAFNNWLADNYATLTTETMQGPRERLYYLIDSWVKMLYARDHLVLPAAPDAVLQTLFFWSERLGVFGGSLIHKAVKSPQFPEAPAVLPVPSGFDLSLRKDMLRLTSASGGWSVEVPYYFMIWNIQEFAAKGGPKTQLVAVSTGAARDEGRQGHSQATLMLLFGPGVDRDDFVPYWSRQLGFSGDEPEKQLGARSRKSRERYDSDQKMHFEYTDWSSKRGAFVIAYIGLEGTYQWNRPHFIDFVRAIQEN